MSTKSDPRDVILAPVVSEKSYSLLDQNAYTFKVHPDANKTEIRQAVERLFDVTVVEVRTMNVRAKPKRRGLTSGKTRAWKKAVVQVSEGDSIPVFAGLEVGGEV